MMARKPNILTEAHQRSSHGDLLAVALAGSWRDAPKPLELNAGELTEMMPLLLKSGSGALVWRCLKDSGIEDARLSFEFERAYRVQLLDAAVHAHNLGRAFTLFRDAGIEPVLVKGWAIARHYTEPALRPYGDIDLCVRRNQFRAAQKVVESAEGRKLWIDLHEGFSALDGRDEAELYARTRLVRLGETDVRVLCEEDHLRVLCLHLLRHGAWRPLWLCDVGVALETRSEGFDWKLFLGDDRREADWLACVIGLAHQLLGARIDDTPVALRAQHLPRWLTRAVLRRWSWWFDSDYRDRAVPSLLKHFREPAKFFRDIYFRCDPIRATVELKGAFNALPRAPYQLAAVLKRSPEFPRHVARLLRA
ncbi:MAG: nucleotidyltransferase family protein [Pyrinomonadaceae bacterium]|nr:nucleotidyltransferase family protein [Pyrinomonadaceae bacterium]